MAVSVLAFHGEPLQINSVDPSGLVYSLFFFAGNIVFVFGK